MYFMYLILMAKLINFINTYKSQQTFMNLIFQFLIQQFTHQNLQNIQKQQQQEISTIETNLVPFMSLFKQSNRQDIIKSPRHIDDMLLQLREILQQTSGKTTQQSSKQKKSNRLPPHPNLNLSPQNNRPHQQSQQQIQNYIQESSRIIEQKHNKSTNKSSPVVRGKILAASQLLRDQKPMIKTYIKQKIESQLFSSSAYPLISNSASNSNLLSSYKKISKEHIQQLSRQKEQIIRTKQLEIQKQNQRRRSIIRNIKDFQTNSRVKVEMHQIDSLIYKEQPESSYLLNPVLFHSNSRGIKSKSNEVKNLNLSISDVYSIQEYQKGTERNNSKNPFADDQYLEMVEEESFLKFKDLDYSKHAGLNKVLKKHPHLVKIFAKFLQNQIQINNLETGLSFLPDLLQKISSQQQLLAQSQQPTSGHLWKNPKKKPLKSMFSSKSSKNIKVKSFPTISQISQTMRFKGFSINQQNQVQYQRKKLSSRRVNKMIGQSKNFHAKQCILTNKKQLIYYEQGQDNSNRTSTSSNQLYIPSSDTKSLQLQLQRVVSTPSSKQQGSFFSKKTIQIQVINLKGKLRSFKFQKDMLDGQLLVYDLRKLLAGQIYQICCKFSGTNNLNLYSFIVSQIQQPDTKASTKPKLAFDLSNQFMIRQQGFIKKENREMFIKMLSDLIEKKKSLVQTFTLSRSKLMPGQISDLAKQGRKFQNLKKIQVNNLRITKDNFTQLCQLANEGKGKSQMEVTLTDTKLDDDHFVSNVGVFTSFCSRVKSLNISNNNITSKTIQIIKNCLQSVTSQVKCLYVSNCPIRDMSKLSALIKQSRKLEVLQAQGCYLNLHLKTPQQIEQNFDFVKKCNPLLKTINLSRNGILNQQKYRIIERMWNVQTIQTLEIDLGIGILLKQNQKTLQKSRNNEQKKNLLINFKINPHKAIKANNSK